MDKVNIHTQAKMEDARTKSYALGFIALILMIPLFTGSYGAFVYTFTIPLFCNVVLKHEGFSSLGVTLLNFKRSVVVGVLSGVLMAAVCAIFMKFVVGDKVSLATIAKQPGIMSVMHKSFDSYLLMLSNDKHKLVMYFLYMFLFVGLGEEIFWRGFIQGHLVKRLTKKTAVLITSILFMLAHIYICSFLPLVKGLSFVLLIGVASMIWGYIYISTKNIWSAAISHGITAFITWRYLFFQV